MKPFSIIPFLLVATLFPPSVFAAAGTPFETWKTLNGFVPGSTTCAQVESALGKPSTRVRSEKSVAFEYLSFASSSGKTMEIFTVNNRRVKKLGSVPVAETVEKILVRFESSCAFKDFLYFTPNYDSRL